MFRYGLVGSTIFYGMVASTVGAIVYELDNLTNDAVKLDDKLASEVLGYANIDKLDGHRKKEYTSEEVKRQASKIGLEATNLQILQDKFEVKDDFDTGKDADI